MLTAGKMLPLIRPADGTFLHKKIAFIFNHSSFQGGGEISFFELIKGIDRAFIDLLVIVPGKGEIEECTSAKGIEVKVCPFASLRNWPRGLPLWTVIKLSKIFRIKNIDLIHANGSRACLYSEISGRLLKIPVIWHVRETKKDITVYDKLLAHFASDIICVSDGVLAKRFGKFGSLITDKIHVVYNGVDTKYFNQDPETGKKVRQQLGIGRQILFGIVGNLIPLKGHDFFIKALAKAKRSRPDLEIKAVFLGRFLDAEYKKVLYGLAADLQLQEDVIFNGYCGNIPAYLSALDVFVLPSRREGCSRALLEAMSAGLPVIASKISENEEVVKPDKNAILVQYGDISQMAKAITELAENSKLRDDLGRENRQRAQAVFSMRLHVENIQRVYKKVLIGNRRENTYAHCH